MSEIGVDTIVFRLRRQGAGAYGYRTVFSGLLIDSADEIERLKARVEELEKALEEITAACELDCTSDATELGDMRLADEDSVGGGEDGDMALTFGMIRRARTALSLKADSDG